MGDPIPSVAAVGFDRGAAAYAVARPGYPLAVVDALVEAGVSGGSSVCDLAAGTGLLTRRLMAGGYRVTAVEPVASMRAELRRGSVGGAGDLAVVAGTAEAIPARDHCFAAVTVGQAFHWFDASIALGEIERVLDRDGAMLLVWNVRDESVDWVRRWTRLVVNHAGERPYRDHRDLRWSDVVGEAGAFTPITTRRARNDVAATPQSIVERTRSTSFVATMEPRAQAVLLDEVAQLIASHPDTAGRSAFTFPYVCEIHWCRRR